MGNNGSRLVLPKSLSNRDSKPFRGLLNDEEQAQQVFKGIDDAIWRSFAEDVKREPFKQHKPKRSEIKRRFKICETWFRRARGDLGYSVERTLDLMGHALRSELDGDTYNPPSGGPTIWTPT